MAPAVELLLFSIPSDPQHAEQANRTVRSQMEYELQPQIVGKRRESNFFLLSMSQSN